MIFGTPPEKFDMEYLIEHQDDSSTSEYLMGHYEKHLDDFEDKEKPKAFLMMGYIVMRVTEDMEDGDRFIRYNEAALDLCGKGLDAVERVEMDAKDFDVEYRLYIQSAFVLTNLERYEDAEDSLDKALELIAGLTKKFEESKDEAALDDIFLDELSCRSYRGEIWWRMSGVTDGDEKRDLLIAAKECLEYTVDFFRRLEYEWETKYFGEILEIVGKDLEGCGGQDE